MMHIPVGCKKTQPIGITIRRRLFLLFPPKGVAYTNAFVSAALVSIHTLDAYAV